MRRRRCTRESDPALTYQITVGSLVGSDTLTGALTRDAGEDVGTYAITQGTLAASGNYNLTYVGADLTITNASMTVDADGYSGVYDAAAHDGVLNVDPSESDATITYSTDGGTTYSATMPQYTNVGTHTVWVKASKDNYDDATTSVTVTITKRPITVTADAQTKVYGESDPALTYQITVGSLVGSDTLTGALTRDAGEDVGTYAITQGTLAASGNYNLTYVGADLTITNASMTVDADGYSGVYDAAAHDGVLNVDPSESDATITYSTDGGTTYSATMPQYTNVGTHTVWVKASKDNYDDATTSVTVTITKRPITVTADAQTKVYGESDPALTYQITVGSLVGSDTLTGALTRDAGEDVGTYAITQGTLAASGNYNLTYVGADLTITNASMTVDADGYSGVYDAAAHDGVLNVDPSESDATITYSTDGGTTYSATMPQYTNVGTHTVWVKASKDNYDDATTSVTVTITKRPITVTADAQTKVYGESDPALTYQITVGSLVGSDTLTGALTRDAGEDVGTYAITQGTLAASGNYNLTYVGADLTITNASMTVDADGYSGVYDAAAHDGVLNVDPSESDATITYSTDGGTTYSATMPQYTNVGTHTVWVKASKDNYDDATTSVTVTITKRPITVTADAQTKVYGESDPALTYQITVGSLVGSDTLTGALTRDAGEDVGTYAITQGTLAASGNYNLTYVGADLTITNASMTVDADGYSGVYDAAAHDGVLNVDPSESDATITYSTDGGTTYSATMPQYTNVGTHTVWVKASKDNYDDATTSVTVTITKRPITVTADAQTKVYGESDPALTYQITVGSLVGSDTLTGALTRDAGEDVGTYAITQGTLAASGNYNLTYVGADLTITNASMTVDADGYSGVYDAAAHDGVLNVDPSESDATITYSTDGGTTYSATMPQYTNVGTHTVWVKASKDNYDDATTSVTVTITKRPITVTADAQTKVYGESDPALTYQITVGSLVGSDTLTGALTRDAGEDVGTYAITQGTLAASGNYNLTYVGADLTITNASMTVDADGYSGVYDAAAHDGVLNVDPSESDATITYSTDGGTTYSATMPQYTNVGTHTVWVKASKDNYDDATTSVTVTITKRPITVTADAQTKVYGESDPALTYQITVGSLVGSDTLTGALTRDAGEDVGTYAITQGTLAASGNYNLTYVGADLTITNASMTVDADGYSGVYDAAAHDGVLNVDPSESDATITYSTDGGTTYSATMPQYTNVGTHTVWVKASKDNYDDATTSVTVTITKRPITVTAGCADEGVRRE